MSVIKTVSTAEVATLSSVAAQLSKAVAASKKRAEAEKSMFDYAREAASLCKRQFDAKLGLKEGVDKLVTAYQSHFAGDNNVRSIFRDALLLFCAGDKKITVTKQAKGSEPETVAAATAATEFAKNDVRSAATALREAIGAGGNRNAGRKANKPVVAKAKELSDGALLMILGDRMSDTKTAAKVCDLLRSLGYEVTKVKARPSARAMMAATKPLVVKKSRVTKKAA